MRWILLILVVAAIVADLVGGLTGTSLTLLAGLGLVYAGERMFADDATFHWLLSGGGTVVVLLALGLRGRRFAGAKGNTRDAERLGLLFAALASLSIPAYFLSTLSDSLGLVDEGARRWQVVWQALSPILGLSGLIPAFQIDRIVNAHPRILPAGAAARAWQSGLAIAFAVALVFPVNYLAAQHVWEKDVAYFRVTRPGTATLAMVQALPDNVEALLFYPPGNDVAREMAPYFAQLEAASAGKLVVRTVDQAVEPKLAEELKVRENGTIVLRRGDTDEKIKIGTELDKAKRDLKKLDGTLQKSLMKLAKGARTAYFTVGHGEASNKERDNPMLKLGTFRTALEALNFKVKNLGVAEGLSDAVPDDATLVVIASPEKPFLPEEEAAVAAYLERGGRLLLLVDPEREKMPTILGKLGLTTGAGVLANGQQYLVLTRGPVDRANLVSTRFGTHAVSSTLSKYAGQVFVGGSGMVALSEQPGGLGKATAIVRAMDGTWEDVDGDFEKDADEKSESFTLAYAVSADLPAAADGSKREMRAVVIGDSTVLSDLFLARSQGNGILANDAYKWLVDDEALAGTTENEEDVKIEHTHEEDQAWFYGSVFAVPGLVLAAGLILNARRNRRNK